MQNNFIGISRRFYEPAGIVSDWPGIGHWDRRQFARRPSPHNCPKVSHALFGMRAGGQKNDKSPLTRCAARCSVRRVISAVMDGKRDLLSALHRPC